MVVPDGAVHDAMADAIPEAMAEAEAMLEAMAEATPAANEPDAAYAAESGEAAEHVG